MIEVKCYTALDSHQLEEWPTKLAVRPLIGDRITPKSGHHLKVIEVRHLFDGTLRIELNKTY